MVLCSFPNCKKVAAKAVELICCRLLVCLACAQPGFYAGTKQCPECSKIITEGDLAEKDEARKRIEQLRKKYEQRKDRTMSRDEKLRLKEAITCKVCKEPCNKAVSLACCPSASCRKCALGKLREDNTKCWGCGELSADVNTLSQLVNNHLVRVGVAFYKEKQLDKSSATFEIFVLLANTDILETRDHFKKEKLLKRKLADNAAKERERETKPLSGSDQAQLQRLLMRNKRKLEPDGEPSQSQLEVRDIFTGTGITRLNKKLAKGERRFDGTTVQRHFKSMAPVSRRPRPPRSYHPPPTTYHKEMVGGGGRAMEGLLDRNTCEKISKAWIRGEKHATVETKSEFWKHN